jgi:hypothetical protein
MPIKKKTDLIYVTLRVFRPLSKAELKAIQEYESKDERSWEYDRQAWLFDLAVLAKDPEDAKKRLRELLASPDLVIEVRNGVPRDVKKVPPAKPSS